ncbi:hypothetical protein PoMZ_11476 [Pyricularia oryzae]|uniref:alpha-1,2-Mannosidase n=1 Tax=Pyricularia oryzae TaxID=318829 RepID=A0A4P7NKH7_PYROR|nr:hypothetical protein PoMZ_11476 [Pyricularia oryzae]
MDQGRSSAMSGCVILGPRAAPVPAIRLVLLPLLLLLSCFSFCEGMRPAQIADLRRETVELFYHGFDNYMEIAFPEDELRPVTCAPLTRDPKDPTNISLNDVLGNYSLTLVDSLSTLAILASAPKEDGDVGPKALRDFQDGVKALVEQYGDGTDGPSGQGLRARGFDVDSKVQVFETVIRGVGGLLSAHLFAAGELPIRGYEPLPVFEGQEPKPWPNGMTYNGQLLRLANDLADRLLPAFYTQTGMPYPRVNLRHGIPFYRNSPLHDTSGINDEPNGRGGAPEITETCSAGAGSLVLEFTVLSRLTGDPKYEQLAKRAFWAVWYRRSDIGLIGAGVDAEHGKWIGAYSVIGAGADSFFEYAMKTHILLSGHAPPKKASSTDSTPGKGNTNNSKRGLDPNILFPPLTDEENSPDSFLEAWHHAHAATKRHLYNDRGHPHYVSVNLWTGSLASQWIDSLGAYYSGLLTLAGELDEAIETNLLYAAVWTKYAALPERWNVRDKIVEGGLGWWPLRPEFVESTYFLYLATKDPWYLHVGEMVLRDVTRRCKTSCGWAGLQNVIDGEMSDRMESFFLGETAKYMYLMYDENHPLNKIDAPFVFTTEGHPLIIPKATEPGKSHPKASATRKHKAAASYYDPGFTNSCPVPKAPMPLTGSLTAARKDIFHAAKMVNLHQTPVHSGRTVVEDTPGRKRATKENHSVFPWTLPSRLIPEDGICSKVHEPTEITLEFASNAQQAVGGSSFNYMVGTQNLERLTVDKIRVLSISGLKLTLRLEDRAAGSGSPTSYWRITKVNGLPLGRDESLVLNRATLGDVSDPRFNMVRDPVVVKLHHLHQVDLVYNVTAAAEAAEGEGDVEIKERITLQQTQTESGVPMASAAVNAPDLGNRMKSFFQQIMSSLEEAGAEPTYTPRSGNGVSTTPGTAAPPYNVLMNLTGITPTGLGAAPLPSVDMPPGAHIPHMGPFTASYLPWSTVFAAGDACGGPLPEMAPRDHHVIVIRRGGCSFSTKLANIPAHKRSSASLQLVVVVSDDDEDDGFFRDGREGGGMAARDYDRIVRPLLDVMQTTPSGMVRHNPLSMLLVGGGDAAYHQISQAERLGLTRRYYIESHGVRVRNILIDDGDSGELTLKA